MFAEDVALNQTIHPMAPAHLPFYLAPEQAPDPLLVAAGVFLIAAVFGVGLLFWTLHSLPERIAHKSQKLQFEIVAVLGLLALFTHVHAFWVAALVLAVIDLPDFGTPLGSMARSLRKMSGEPPEPERNTIDAEPAQDQSDRPVTRIQTHA